MELCKHCSNELNGNFCSFCGKPAKLNRIDRAYIRREIANVLNLDKGFFFTIKELIIRPGSSIRNFLETDRHRLVKPIIFILVSSLIYSLVNGFFNFEEHYINYNASQQSSLGVIMKWMQSNYGYANIMMGIFIAFFVKLFFRKYQYNVYEILILICYIVGIAMLILALFVFLQVITGISVMTFASVLIVFYITWSIADFFDSKKVVNYVKSLSSYMVGMIVFFLLIMSVGILIDFIKHI